MNYKNLLLKFGVVSVICLALLVWLVPAAHAEQGPEFCLTCHSTQAKTWMNAPHANSQKVTCESCHGAYVADHPKTQMKVNKQPEACKDCHSAMYTQWQTSKHGGKGLACASCHDPHGATIKTGTSIELCVKCHADKTTSHAMSAGKNLSCADCHLSKTADHTFMVSSNACLDCHAKAIHSSSKGGGAAAPAPNAETATATAAASGGIPVASGVAGLVIASVVLGLVWRQFGHRS